MSTSAPRRLTPWRRGCGGSSSTSCRGCSAWRDRSMTRTDTGEHDTNTGRYLIYLVLDIWIYVTCRYLLLIFAFYYWWLNLLIGFNFAWKFFSNQNKNLRRYIHLDIKQCILVGHQIREKYWNQARYLIWWWVQPQWRTDDATMPYYFNFFEISFSLQKF